MPGPYIRGRTGASNRPTEIFSNLVCLPTRGTPAVEESGRAERAGLGSSKELR